MLVLTGAAASAQSNTVYAGQTSTLEVVEIMDETYEWQLYNDVEGINLAVVMGNCPASEAFFVGGNTGPEVQVTWLVPGTYYFKVLATNNCPAENMAVGEIIVLPALPVATILPPGEICEGDELVLEIEFTGTAPWEFDLFDGVNTVTYTADVSPYMTVVLPSPTTTTTYTVTRVMDVNGTNTTPSNSVTVTVNPQPVFNSPIYSVP